MALAAAVAFGKALGALPVGLYTTDYQFLVEAARRIALGQTPHVDFSAPVGPLIFWLLAAARHLPALGPDALAVNALMWAIAAPLATVVAARLPSRRQAAALVAVAALVVLAPFNLEPLNDACDLNYNGIYNRHGAALLFLAFVAALRPPGRLWHDAVLLGGLLGAMLLSKVTYGFAGLAVLALAGLFSPPRLRALGLACVLLAAAAVALETATGVVSGYLRDIAHMARLNSGNILALLWGGLLGHTLLLLTALALVATLAAEPLRTVRAGLGDRLGPQALRPLALPALAGACVALTLWTESQSTGGAGLVAIAALAFAPGLGAGRWGAAKIVLAAGVAFLAVGLLADQVWRRGRCVVSAAADLRTDAAVDALVPSMRVGPGRIVAGELAARLWRDHRSLADAAYARGFDFNLESFGAPVSFVANAALALEAAERFKALGLGRSVRHATTLGFVDDFTPLLGLAPAPGLRIVLDPYRTIGPPTKAEALAYLAPVDAAFERSCATPSFVAAIAAFFRPALEEAFEPVELTPCWTVHLRRAGSAGR